MQITTTKRFAPMPSQKEWSWSYSKLKNFETCPRRHQHVDILKDFKDDSENLEYGNRVHAAAAAKLDRHVPLGKEYAFLEPWCQIIEMAARKLNGKILVEQQLAITRDHRKTGWFSPDTYFRAVADAVVLAPPNALSFDWKTGKIIEDSVQLALVAATLFVHHPDVHKVRSQFIWLKEGCESTVDIERHELPSLWAGLAHRVEALELASVSGQYPPKPGPFCKRWCPVTSCQYYGIGSQ